MLKGKKIMLVGGAGFIGSRVVRDLVREGEKVVGMARLMDE